MIDGYKEWLQTVLGEKYRVVLEEEVDYNTSDIENLIILSQFSGTNFRTCVSLVYQLTCYAKNVKETMSDLQTKTWQLNEMIIATNEFPYIRHLMAQPVNNSNFININKNYAGVITITTTLICSLNLTDIESVVIDGEPINPTNATITYQTQVNNNRKNNEELNESNIDSANLNLQITMPIDKSNFYKKARNVMFGAISKNTTFKIKITYVDGFVYESNFKLSSEGIQFERASLTTATITLIK